MHSSREVKKNVRIEWSKTSLECSLEDLVINLHAFCVQIFVYLKSNSNGMELLKAVNDKDEQIPESELCVKIYNKFPCI